MDELVSIIMPTYNCGQFISDTIKSVQEQTYQNWELIIVDDCSCDNTQKIIKERFGNDSRIQYHCLSVNSGAAVARTMAMKLAKGSYMAFLDSDDLWIPQKLETQLKFMKRNHYNFTCTAYQKINESGDFIKKIVRCLPRTDYHRLLLDCPVGNSTVMYNVSSMGKFQVPDIRKRNDDALWLQMLKKEKYIYGYPRVMTYYRVRKHSLSRNKLSLVKYHWTLYRKIEHLSISLSVLHILYWGIIKIFHIK